jgi:predicted RNA-binding Zn-ribbon protein involved in translation (DUF1610 family)
MNKNWRDTMAFCANCGVKLEEGVKYCCGCGTPVGYLGVEIKQDKAVNIIQTQPAPLPMSAALKNQTIAADEKYCFSCGLPIKKAAEICPKCGVNQNTRNNTIAIDVYCTSCGKSIKKDASTCPFCGVQQDRNARLFKKDKKGLAKASLILGIIGSLFGIAQINALLTTPIEGSVGPALFPFILAANIIALIFAVKGFNSTKKGMAIAGLILSIVGIVTLIISAGLLNLIMA